MTSQTDEQSPARRAIWRRWAGHVVSAACARPWLVLLASLLITGLLVPYIGNNLGVQTDRDKMLSNELDFKQAQKRYEEAFPFARHNLVIVIDADTSEDARNATLALAEKGMSASLTFDAPGDFPYYCSLHGTADNGQTGRVIVVP